MKLKAMMTILGLLILQACKDSSGELTVPMIGLDDANKATIRHMPREKFLRKVGPLLSSVSNTTIKKLQSTPMTDWEIKRLTVGLQLAGALNLSSKVKMEAKPAIEFRFERWH